MNTPIFQKIQIKAPKSNLFDLSHEKKLSCNMSELIPFLVQPVIPGDKFRVNTEILVRLAPMVAPMMHRVNVYTHYFFVPNRLVWSNWEPFITGGEAGTDAHTIPTMDVTDGARSAFFAGTLADYMGIPTPPDTAFTDHLLISALPFRAYQLIYNEYYRDQNLQAKVGMTTNDTVDTNEAVALLTLRKRAWEKDYYTSSLPWAQRGGSVNLPTKFSWSGGADIIKGSTGSPVTAGNLTTSATGQLIADQGAGADVLAGIDLKNLGISINDLRNATRLQEWLERNARAGSRYVEFLLAHFGVKLGDYRAFRPVYLGGGKSPVTVSEVLATAKTTDLPQGNMAGHGVAVANIHGFKYSFPEFGYVIGIMSTIPKTAYQQGVPREYVKSSKFDFYFPEFANLGEQDVYDKEVYMNWTGAVGSNNSTFGYQSRYSEYKFGISSVHGDFKSSLAYWHMGRIFTSKPTLNESFIVSDPTHRVFAVTDTAVDKLYIQLYNNVKAIRPMPVFGTPTL